MTERKGSMLTEKRQKEILRFLDEKGSVTVQELTERLDASESTIRRDLAVLHQKGALVNKNRDTVLFRIEKLPTR